MQIPIITNESLSQMTLMQLTSYVLKLLSEALPHIENIENDEASAAASASAAEASASAAAASFAKVEPAVNDGINRINAAVNSGYDLIARTITTVLNTEV